MLHEYRDHYFLPFTVYDCMALLRNIQNSDIALFISYPLVMFPIIISGAAAVFVTAVVRAV